MSLESILQEIKSELMQKNGVREVSHDNMRKATSQSKQAILRIHQKRFDEAQKLVTEAKTLLQSVQERSKEYPDIVYGGMLSAAYQEYAEAKIFLTLIKEKRFVMPTEIGVPSVDYILGLSDVIGEYRRLSLDYLREGEVEKGVRCLQVMDEIFIQLLTLDEAYMLVPGLRHKSDTARRIIESTRGDITLEVRRKSLEDYLRKFTTQTRKGKPKKTRKKKLISQTKTNLFSQKGGSTS